MAQCDTDCVYVYFLLCIILCFNNQTAMASYGRPRLRSKLAQSVYDKMLMDEKLKIMDFSMWYKVHEVCLSDVSKASFLQMSLDAETKAFVDACFEASDYIFLQMWHTLAKSFLGMFMTQTSINGLLNRGRMFVWSREQAKQLLGDDDSESSETPLKHSGSAETQLVQTECEASSSVRNDIEKDVCIPEEIYFDALIDCPKTTASTLRPDYILSIHPRTSTTVNVGDDGEEYLNDRTEENEPGTEESEWWNGKKILDLGAGDGHVTQILSNSAKEICVTETSPIMRKKLSSNGYRVLDVDSWFSEVPDEYFDLISCLNLLDRCDMPVSLLKDIYRKLSWSGKLVVAIVLPISPYVETGSSDHEPSEELGVTGTMIEEQVNSLIEDVFPRLGFNIVRWTRLPYLCEGDLDQAFYWLSDIVFILNKIPQHRL